MKERQTYQIICFTFVILPLLVSLHWWVLAFGLWQSPSFEGEVLFPSCDHHHHPPLRSCCCSSNAPLANNGRTLLRTPSTLHTQLACSLVALSQAFSAQASHTLHHTHTHRGPATRRPRFPRRLFFVAAATTPKTMRVVLPVLCLCLSYAAAFMPATPASALRGESLSNPPPFSPLPPSPPHSRLLSPSS